MEVFDNINNRLFDSLKKEIKPTNRISIAANTFFRRAGYELSRTSLL